MAKHSDILSACNIQKGRVSTMDNLDKEVFNVKDLQTVLGVGRDTAYALMRNKSFPAIKIGSRYIVEAEAFKQWLKRSAGKEIYL